MSMSERSNRSFYLFSCLAVLTSVACGGDDNDNVAGPATTGAIEVRVTTTGDGLDQDGYTLSVDAGQAQAIAINDTITIASVTPGDHVVTLDGIAGNCTAAGSTSQTHNVEAGFTAVATFTIACTQATIENQIVFSSYRVGFGLHRMNPDGTDQSLLKIGGFNPDVSPDGSLVAYDTTEHIEVALADGTNPTRITENVTSDYDPAWSPDGTRIAFTSERDGNLEIYVMNTDGSNQTNLTNHAARDHQPTWSSDGTQIAFASDRDTGDNIFVMNPMVASPST